MNKLNFKLNLKQIIYIIFSLITFTLLIVYSAYTIADFIKYLNLIPLLDKIEPNENIRILIEHAYKEYAITSSIFIFSLICCFVAFLLVGINVYFDKLKNIFKNKKITITFLSIFLTLSTLIILHHFSYFTKDVLMPDKNTDYLLKTYLPNILLLLLIYLSSVFISIMALIKMRKQSTIIELV